MDQIAFFNKNKFQLVYHHESKHFLILLFLSSPLFPFPFTLFIYTLLCPFFYPFLSSSLPPFLCPFLSPILSLSLSVSFPFCLVPFLSFSLYVYLPFSIISPFFSPFLICISPPFLSLPLTFTSLSYSHNT